MHVYGNLVYSQLEFNPQSVLGARFPSLSANTNLDDNQYIGTYALKYGLFGNIYPIIKRENNIPSLKGSETRRNKSRSKFQTWAACRIQNTDSYNICHTSVN